MDLRIYIRGSWDMAGKTRVNKLKWFRHTEKKKNKENYMPKKMCEIRVAA